jgi:hypothetical protein
MAPAMIIVAQNVDMRQKQRVNNPHQREVVKEVIVVSLENSQVLTPSF